MEATVIVMTLANIPLNTLFAALLLSNDDSDTAALIPLLLCLAGFIYFAIMYARYRNSDKRHLHEQETPATILNLQQYDQLNKHLKRLRNSSMNDRNDHLLEGALNTSANPLLEQLPVVKDIIK
jgi:hypothetical protein